MNTVQNRLALSFHGEGETLVDRGGCNTHTCHLWCQPSGVSWSVSSGLSCNVPLLTQERGQSFFAGCGAFFVVICGVFCHLMLLVLPVFFGAWTVFGACNVFVVWKAHIVSEGCDVFVICGVFVIGVVCVILRASGVSVVVPLALLVPH